MSRENGKRVIRKYPNRRLYDTEDSKYITLQDVVELIKDREKIVVVSHQTRKDITREVLFDTLRHIELARPVPVLGTDQVYDLIRRDHPRSFPT